MARPDWTAARDARLKRMRAEGALWPEIGIELGVSPDVARERGRRIGARPPYAPPPPFSDDPCRFPLPAGHPRSWGLLVGGTLLAGTDWPGWAA